MPISYSAAGLPAAAAARNAGPPIPGGNAFAGCAVAGAAGCAGAAMFIGAGIEPVVSADGVGAIRAGVGMGATSGAVEVCLAGGDVGVAGWGATAAAGAAGGGAGATGSATLRGSG